MADITLRGEFVTLRPLAVDDAAVTLGWRQSARAANLNAAPRSVQQQAKWIATRPDSEYNFVIELKDGRPVGMVSLTAVDTIHRRAEPGRFLIGDEEAVRGVPAAVEAMKLIYEFAFGKLGLQRVHGAVASDNSLMIKWQKFMGLTEEGRLRNHYFINGKFQDAVVFGMLAEEYRARTEPKMEVFIKAARKAQ
ncbi:Protein N-acetyltransferase, RimJ/RimL family [Mycobacterium rhizamassiliense]|uniref:Protein N-acetyltransferase, RimJ/RimL family n=1 Tax=Mycobacterium rhizamassiliense TaxID=1841860 RepID=A0A2U3NZZ0_9MYCO|nr:GNAT family N-acetyltransferase [Mycobacterium rhizamassiliense]SPM37083.1 Protein N-acetyltransferase, RimJ/RimL family [Mycobacterium rhizamassiliense]